MTIFWSGFRKKTLTFEDVFGTRPSTTTVTIIVDTLFAHFVAKIKQDRSIPIQIIRARFCKFLTFRFVYESLYETCIPVCIGIAKIAKIVQF